MKRPSIKKPPQRHSVVFSQAVEQGRTFYHEKAVLQDKVAVICGGIEHCSPHYLIDRKDFPFLCLEWVASGLGEVTLNKKKYPLQAGSLFLYGPGVDHRIVTDKKERLIKYFVDFEGPGALMLLTGAGLKIPGVYRLPLDSGMLEIFDRLIETGTRAPSANPRLLHLLLKCLIAIAAEKHPEPEGLQGRAYQTYMRCRNYIQHNIRNLHRMEDVVKACHLDPAYLTRVFRRFSRESPHRFMTRLKMNAAALQLVRRNALVKEIAVEFNYADPYHFSKTFKKIHGLSPEKYLRSRTDRTR